MFTKIGIVTFLLVLPYLVYAVPEPENKTEEVKRDSKILPIFQVVRFPNDKCSGTSYNGTCYTSEECSSRGGTSEGTCASGFGVCCTFALTSCGGTSNDNNSYIVKSSFTSLTTIPCEYKICPCSSDICRIRYDFTTLTLASQETATAATDATSPADTAPGVGFEVGNCVIDQFQISAPGGHSSPVICGTNTGYHMILDSNGRDCQISQFNIGTSTTSTREWSIRVTQYTCAEEDVSGSPGCLQYYTAVAGNIQNFGFPTSITTTSNTVSLSVTHLNNQLYDICIRRIKGYCYICYNPIQTTESATTQASWGISTTVADDDDVNTDTDCTTDFIEIPQGELAPTVSATANSQNSQAAIGPMLFANKFCGHIFGVDTASIDFVTVCSRQYPFRVGVNFDQEEVCATPETAITCEWNLQAASMPAGIVGFKLFYWQTAC